MSLRMAILNGVGAVASPALIVLIMVSLGQNFTDHTPAAATACVLVVLVALVTSTFACGLITVIGLVAGGEPDGARCK